MESFPSFIRKAEHSPRSLDSAFPPFNPVHKYRGVYERAGFEINKKAYKQQQNGEDRGSNRSISSSSRWGTRNQSSDSFGNRSNGSGRSYKTATKESLPLVGAHIPTTDSRVKSGESSSQSSKSNSMNSYGQNDGNSASTSHRTSPEYSQYNEQQTQYNNNPYEQQTQYNSNPYEQETQYNNNPNPYGGEQYERKHSNVSNHSYDSSGQTVRTVQYDNDEAEEQTLNNSNPYKQPKNVKNLTLDLNNNVEEQEYNNQQEYNHQEPQLPPSNYSNSSMHSFHSKNSNTSSHHSSHSVPLQHSNHSDHSVASHHSSHSYRSNRSNNSIHIIHQEVIQEVPETTDSSNYSESTSKEDKYAQDGYQLPTPMSASGPAPSSQMYNQRSPPPPPTQPFDPRKMRKRPPISMNGPPSAGPYPPQANRNISPASNGPVPYPVSPNYSPSFQQQSFANQMNGMPPMPGSKRMVSPTGPYQQGQQPPMHKGPGPSPTAMYHRAGMPSPGMPRSMTGMPNQAGIPPMMPNTGMPRSMTGIPPTAPPTWNNNGQHHSNSPSCPPRSQMRPVPPPMVGPIQQQQPYYHPQPPMSQQLPSNQHQMVLPNQQRYQTGVPRQPTYSQIREDKLSPALDEFKQDLEETHQSSSGPYNQSALSQMTPDLNSARFENSLNGRLMEDPEESMHHHSQDHHHQQQQQQQQQQHAQEYQQFLSTEPMNKSDDYKRGSTVSSILSKDSADEVDEEERRIERELEAQLQHLKSGGEPEYQEEEDEAENMLQNASPQKSVSQESTVSAPRPPIPQFTVQDVDEVQQSRDSAGSNNTKDSNCDEMSIASIESIKPLSVSHSHISPIKKDMSLQDNDPYHNPYGVPERKDSAEFTKIIAEIDHFEEEMPRATPDVSDNAMDPQLDPLDNDTDNTSISESKPRLSRYEPGMGPCRSCHQPIDPSARGSLKAIFSKTGELSGQWHRACFKCSYQSCPTHFNKKVQCYVLDDEPYCFQHYHLLNATTCKSCGVGIEGSCIENDLGQKWHMHCLKCSCCHGPIDEDYYVVNDRIMCEADAKSYLNNGGGRSGNDKVEKRRTRMFYA
ncbi:hypothetical protein I9W82_001662 [Candida metapsilosis]|uniref:LIM zinc-binding domain-containing protein n=1 Tax=Candida metapsilosis TaxID=273372 RepID=A0A8H8DBZ6_9ASCO|nr:hypothetical protein I9W82_001662 [Candida metapsilosis]